VGVLALHAPPQPKNDEPDTGAAVSVTSVGRLIEPTVLVQSEVQSICTKFLARIDTVPLPGPPKNIEIISGITGP
jgi:hypothetical protein